jgi:diadenosine tetraphosphatase ApaH/serine/threonine PP2A family protein phosphatase
MAIMLIALIADVHANQLALQACLERVQNLAVDRLVFLGDLVGYGPDPREVINTVRSLQERGAIVIKGNHDHAVSGPREQMNDRARQAIDWTRKRLSLAEKAYLAELPMTATQDDILYVHADASDPAAWNYVTGPAEARASLEATTATYTFCGHVHVPALYCLSAAGKLTAHRPVSEVSVPVGSHRQWLAVIGSAGQPRDGNPAAAFATFDTNSNILTFRRVPYDVDAQVARVRRAGLPDVLAVRLLVGK